YLIPVLCTAQREVLVVRIFITGATGLIGRRLVKRLDERRDQIIVLTRRPKEAREMLPQECRILEGDPTISGAWTEAVAECDAVVNLAGENVFGKRWSQDFKQRLMD